MAKYSKHQKPSRNTIETANNIALGIKKPGQTKEQTKLISQGIQKGIDQYKKQQKTKLKEQDKINKKRVRDKPESVAVDNIEVQVKQHWLPWLLLALSWIAIGGYFLLG